MKTTHYLLATTLALGVAAPVLGGETTTEHETYEKRSMTVEPVPAPAETERRTEERTETSRTQSPPRDGSVIEKHTTVVPGPTVTEKKSERVETENDD